MADKDRTPQPVLALPVEPLIFREVTNHAIVETRSVVMEAVTTEVVRANREKFALPKMYEFATPARQESVRIGLVICGMIGWGLVAKWLNFEKSTIELGLWVIGGIYGVPKVVEKIRGPKDHSKALQSASDKGPG